MYIENKERSKQKGLRLPQHGLPNPNPTKSNKLVIPSKKKTVREALTKDQVLSVLQQMTKLKGTEKRTLALMLLTGMRRGEVLGLRWEDLEILPEYMANEEEYQAGWIHVVRGVTYAKNQPHIGDTKTENGERNIPMDKILWSLLQPVSKTGFIIGGDKPITLMVFRRMWERIEKKVNMFEATPHVFRHSYLTLANNAGVDIKTIGAIGGHGDYSVTANIYVHSQVDQIMKASQKIGASIRENGNIPSPPSP